MDIKLHFNPNRTQATYGCGGITEAGLDLKLFEHEILTVLASSSLFYLMLKRQMNN